MEIVVARGLDPTYGSRLGVALREEGLVDVSFQGCITEWDVTMPFATFYTLTYRRLREVVLAAQALPANDVEQFLNMIQSPTCRALSTAYRNW